MVVGRGGERAVVVGRGRKRKDEGRSVVLKSKYGPAGEEWSDCIEVLEVSAGSSTDCHFTPSHSHQGMERWWWCGFAAVELNVCLWGMWVQVGMCLEVRKFDGMNGKEGEEEEGEEGCQVGVLPAVTGDHLQKVRRHDLLLGKKNRKGGADERMGLDRYMILCHI